MSGYPKDDDDLDDIYSDLSDNDQPKEDKNKPPVNPPGPPLAPNAIKMPAFLGGKAFIPPPPPPTSRPPPRGNPPDEFLQGRLQQHNNHNQNQQGQREKRNVIFIKNLPKYYNRQETLTTFFRTFGNIKTIKTNEQNNSAFVRFQKEQDAYKFMHAKQLILNRSYIMYDVHEDFTVPLDKIQEREKDEIVPAVTTSEKEIALMKENTESQVADEYRAVLFLLKHKNLFKEEEIQSLERDLQKYRKIKEAELDNRELAQILSSLEGVYDWTLSYKVITKESIDKKKIISEFHKFGPVGTIHIKILTGGEAGKEEEQKTGIVKLKFLGVRSSWQMYLQNRDALGLEVEGRKMAEIYHSWFAKKHQEKLMQSSADQQLLQGDAPQHPQPSSAEGPEKKKQGSAVDTPKPEQSQ